MDKSLDTRQETLRVDAMKQKTHWEAEDIRAGMIVCRAHRGKEKWKPDGWTAKWTHKIGFVPCDKGSEGNGHYCQIAMTDGMVYCRGKTKGEMAALLNKEDMILMPYSWWLQTVRYLREMTNEVPVRRFPL